MARRIPHIEDEVGTDSGRAVPPGLIRRVVDVVVALAALVVLAAPMLIVALAIRMESGSPCLYRQRRIGEGGVPFTIYKFRTMRAGSTGSLLTPPGDTRITRLGRFLRATCIDELPQLLNILRGTMTLVGPRPQTIPLAERYPEDLREIFRYRPGLTGPGVLRLNDDDVLPPAGTDVEEFYLREIVPARVRLDMEYCQNPTIARTFGFILETAGRVPKRVIPAGRRRTEERARVEPMPVEIEQRRAS